MTGVGPVRLATRKAPAAEARVGTGPVAEGNPPAPSTPSKRAEIKAIPRHHRPPSGGPKPAAAATAATPKMTAPVGGAATATPASVQAAASATGTCTHSQGQRRDACSISVSPPNSRADARGPNHGAGLPERTHEVSTTGLDFERVSYRCPAGICKDRGEEAEEIERVSDLQLEERLEEERE